MNYLVVLMSLKRDIEHWDMSFHQKYIHLLYEGVDCFYEAYGKGDECLYRF